MNKSDCCEKCVGLSFEHKCFGPAPDCHVDHPRNMTDTTQTTPREERESEFDDLLTKPFADEYFRPKALKDFIRETRTAAYKEGLQAALEALPSSEIPLNDFDVGWNAYAGQARLAIARLQD